MAARNQPDFLGIDRERRAARKQELDARAREAAARTAEAFARQEAVRRESAIERMAGAADGIVKGAEAFSQIDGERKTGSSVEIRANAADAFLKTTDAFSQLDQERKTGSSVEMRSQAAEAYAKTTDAFSQLDKERRTGNIAERQAEAAQAYAKTTDAFSQLDQERRTGNSFEMRAKAAEAYARSVEAVGQFEEERRKQLEAAQERTRQAQAAQAAAQAAQAAQETQSSAVFMLTNRLNAGEISPFMHGQCDRPQYQNGAFEMANMVPMPQGGATRRPGTVFWADLSGQDYAFVRLVPFHFSGDEERLLVLHAPGPSATATMDVWVRSQNRMFGGAKVNASLALPFAGMHLREISFCQSADVIFYAHRSYPPGKISRYSDADWRHDVITWEPDIDPPEILAVEPVGTLQKNDTQRVSYTYVATSVSAETGMESGPSEPFTVEDVGVISNSYGMRVVVSSVPGAAYYRVYREYCGVFGFVATIDAEDAAGA